MDRDIATRPQGLTLLTVLMCVLNLTGFLMLPEEPEWRTVSIVAISVVITFGYVVLWFFWHGQRWAGILVQITSVIALLNLFVLPASPPVVRAIIVAEAVLAVYLLWWWRLRPVRDYFAPRP